MASKWLRGDNKVKKCSEFRTDICDNESHDGCCAVTACTYCLLWEVYGEDDQFGTATFAGNGWYGSVGPISFRGFWERNYQTGDCEFVVEANDEEAYRKNCYEGQSCRDSSDSVDITVGYDEGTLSWSKDLKRPLPLINDPDTGCRAHWCGDCHCTCECLCVTVRDGYTNRTERGELCDSSYECDGPVWAGTIGDTDVSVQLKRDEYDGGCYLLVSGDGEEFEVDVTDCTSLAFSVELYDGTVITGTCKNCGCELICDPCPDPADYPTLTVSIYPIANCSSPAVDVVVTFDDTSQSWGGSGPWTGSGDEIVVLLSCTGNSFMAQFRVTLGGSPTACTFGATSPTNQDCELLLFDWEFIGSTSGKFCCGGGLYGSDIGMTVVL